MMVMIATGVEPIETHVRDEGPSADDIRRFGGDDRSGYCPDCSALIYDDADVCPSCGAYVHGQVLSRPPVDRHVQRRFTILVIIIVLIGFAGGLVGFFRWI